MSQNEITERAMDAIEEAVASHTLAVVAGTGDRELRDVGTGTAISFQGRHFILTARHVVEDTPIESLRFFCRPDGNLQRVRRGELRETEGIPLDQMYMIERIPILACRLSDTEDLAVLSVDRDIERAHRVSFFELDEASATPGEGQTVIAMGYPCDIARQAESGNFVAFSSVEWTEIVVNADLPDYDPARHFVARYHMVDDERTARPQGFSGCGVWFRVGPTPKGQLWTPNLRMAGVFVSYYPRSVMLKAIRIERVIDFLKTVA